MAAYGCCGAYNEHDPKCIHVRYPAERAAWEKAHKTLVAERDQWQAQAATSGEAICKIQARVRELEERPADRLILEENLKLRAVADAAEELINHGGKWPTCSHHDALRSALRSLRAGEGKTTA